MISSRPHARVGCSIPARSSSSRPCSQRVMVVAMNS
jgi:hypothetical protein